MMMTMMALGTSVLLALTTAITIFNALTFLCSELGKKMLSEVSWIFEKFSFKLVELVTLKDVVSFICILTAKCIKSRWIDIITFWWYFEKKSFFLQEHVLTLRPFFSGHHRGSGSLASFMTN